MTRRPWCYVTSCGPVQWRTVGRKRMAFSCSRGGCSFPMTPSYGLSYWWMHMKGGMKAPRKHYIGGAPDSTTGTHCVACVSSCVAVLPANETSPSTSIQPGSYNHS